MRRRAIAIIIPTSVIGFGFASLWLLAQSLTYPEDKSGSFINLSSRACLKACSVFVNMLALAASLYPIWIGDQEQQPQGGGGGGSGGLCKCSSGRHGLVCLRWVARTILVVFFFAVLGLFLSIHHYWVTTGLRNRNLTRELMLIVTIFVPNAIYGALWSTMYVMAGGLPLLASFVMGEVSLGKKQVRWRRVLWLLASPMILIFFVTSTTSVGESSLIDYPNVFSLESTVTGNQFVYSCTSPDETVEFPTPWIAYTPVWVRRLVSGRSGCDLANRHLDRWSLYVDNGIESKHQLLVATSCPGGSRGRVPTILVENLDGNHVGGPEKLSTASAVKAQLQPLHRNWQRYVNSRYAGDNKEFNVSFDTVGNVRKVQRVLSKETLHEAATIRRQQRLTPSQLLSRRERRLFRELETFLSHHKTVHVLPVESGAISVFCDGVEEYHVNRQLQAGSTPFLTHPKSEGAEESSPSSSSSQAPKVNGIAVVILDAVSRPEVLRSLPKTVNWLRSHHKQKVKTGQSPLITEFPAFTTVAANTLGNINALMGGHLLHKSIMPPVDPAEEKNQLPLMAIMSRHDKTDDHRIRYLTQNNVFALAKKRNTRIHTSFVHGLCGDNMQVYWNTTASTTATGFGDAARDIDSHYVTPSCHADYGLLESNFAGFNNIQSRCIGRDHVHQHAFGFLQSQLSQLAAKRQPFLHFMQTMEGHEGTHTVLSDVDEDLERLFKELEADGYFENNALILLSDHGSHMGPYWELTDAGAVEQTMPVLFTMFPQHVVVDAERQEALDLNKHRLVTAFDVYGTILDVMGLDNTIPEHLLEGEECDEGHTLSKRYPSSPKKVKPEEVPPKEFSRWMEMMEMKKKKKEKDSFGSDDVVDVSPRKVPSLLTDLGRRDTCGSAISPSEHCILSHICRRKKK